MSTNNPGGPSPSPYDPPGSGQQPPSPYEPGQAPQQPAAPYQQPGQDPQQPASPYQQSPYQQQPGATPYPAPGYPAQYGGQPFPKNDLGVWALVLGIVSIVMCGFFAGIPAIIVGNKARQAVRNGEADNDGMALAGIITGWIGTAISILVVVFYTIIIVIGVSGGFETSGTDYSY